MCKTNSCWEPGEGNAPLSSTLAWKIPWTQEPGGLQSMGSLRVGHDWATSLSLFTFMHWRRKWQPTPVFLPGESQGRGAWWAAVYGVAQSQTQLKQLSSSSSSSSSSHRNQIKKEKKWVHTGEEEVKLSLTACCLILYIENPKDTTRELLEWTNLIKFQDTKWMQRNLLYFYILRMED